MKTKPDQPPIICFGELLWDMLPEGKKIGGALFNVAYHLWKLDGASMLISRVGKDSLGQEALSFLQKKGLPISLIQTDEFHPTSTVEAKIDKDHEVTYDITRKVAWDYITYNQQLADIVNTAEFLVFGSLAARNDTTEKTLYKVLESPAFKVMDVNLRAPFYTKARLQRLMEKADMIKMNESELKLLTAWFDEDSGKLEENIDRLTEHFDWEIVLVTHGAEGAYLWSENQLIFERTPQIEVADTVGSGDAFLAGFLYAFNRGFLRRDALKIANKMGAFITQKHGGSPDYDKQDSGLPF